ncbi:MAG: hypothetical protein JWL61_1824 [Gemmatimonadetes bacterium]|nr:hypothetical protein [Gemmatimonadota bacterium]
MKDFVVYHNAKRMGYPASQVNALSIVTNKSAAGAMGARVWLVTGEGKPMRFYLCGIFKVDLITLSDHPKLKIQVSGSAGALFDPLLPIDREEWFPEFKHTQGNFAFGFQAITDQRIVRGLEEVSRFAPS